MAYQTSFSSQKYAARFDGFMAFKKYQKNKCMYGERDRLQF